MDQQLWGDAIRLLISHSWRDKNTSERLARDLEAFADVQLDARGHGLDQDLVDSALLDIDGLVLLWTKETASAVGVMAELEAATRLGIPVFPCVFAADGWETHPQLQTDVTAGEGIDYADEALGFGRLVVWLLDILDPDESTAHTDPNTWSDLDEIIDLVRQRRSLSDRSGLKGRALSAIENISTRELEVDTEVDKVLGLVQRTLTLTRDDSTTRLELEAVLVPVAASEHEYPGLMSRLRRLIDRARRTRSRPDIVELDLPEFTFEPETDPQLEMALLTTQGQAGLAGAMVAVSAYLRVAPETLQALHRIANTQASAAMGSAVQSAAAYYMHLDDLLPDRFGVYGRLDDSWLVHHLASHVVAAGLATVDDLPSGWLEAVAADELVREVLPESTVAGLEALLREMVVEVSSHAETYEPLLDPGEREPIINPNASFSDKAEQRKRRHDPDEWKSDEVAMFLGMFGLAVSMYFSLPGQSQAVRLGVAVGTMVISIPLISLGSRGVVKFVRVLANPATATEEWRRARHRHALERGPAERAWVRTVPWFAFVLAMIGVFLFWLGPRQQLTADQRQLATDQATSNALAAESRSTMTQDIDFGLLTSLEAYRVAPTPEAMDSIVSGLVGSTHFVAQVSPPSDGADVIAVSPTGRFLAMGSRGGNIEVWDMNTGQSRATMFDETCGAAHCAAVTALTFGLPDGRQLISGDADGNVRQWDATTGAAQGPPTPFHEHAVRSLSTTADGRILVSSGADSRITIWQVDAGRFSSRIGDIEVGTAFSTAVSHDGEFIAAGGVSVVYLIALETGRVVHEFTGHEGRVLSVEFSRDDRLLISGDTSGGLGRWNPDRLTGEVVEAHNGPITSISLSADATVAASVGGDEVLRVWSVHTHQQTETMALRSGGPVSDVVMGPKGELVVTAGSTGVNVFSVEATERLFQVYNSPGGPAWAVDIEPESDRIASGSVAGRLTVWTPSDSLNIEAEFDAGDEVVRSVVFSANGALAAGIDDGSVWLWDKPSAATSPSLLGRHDDSVRSVDFSGNRVVSASSDGAVAMWAPYLLIGEHETPIRAVAVHPDGGQVASGGDDGVVRIWEIGFDGDATAPEVVTHNDRVWAVAYSPDGARLASAGDDSRGQIVILDTANNTTTRIAVDVEPGRVYTLEFSPDGRMLAAGVDDALHLWDIETLVPIGPPLTGHTNAIRDLAFSSDGGRLATASPDGTIRLWHTDPLVWTDLVCQVVARNMSSDEWNSLQQDDDYVRHCDAYPAGDGAPVEASSAVYIYPADFDAERQFIVVDWMILLVFAAGAAVIALLLRFRRSS